MKTLHLVPIHTTDVNYDYCEELYTKAFPDTERRNKEQQRLLTDTNPLFHFCALFIEHEAVGFLTYWDFGTFLYIEHFAIDEAMRGKNLGSKTLQQLHEYIPVPIILEVERPDTDIARRRIAFYERCGYTLWKSDYLQPPYQDGYPPLPLYLMCHGNFREAKDFKFIKETLYREVYHYKES